MAIKMATSTPTGAVISSMESLVNGSHPGATILIERDPSRGFARLSVNGRPLMECLASSFVPSHMGGWHLELADRHGTWISPETMAIALSRALASLPEGCRIRNSIYMKDDGPLQI